MAGAALLYTPEVLALATDLARWPMADLPLRGSARSATCGSRLDLALALDGAGRIAAIGLAPHACAVGQAALAIFAAGAIGRAPAAIATAEAAIARWLTLGGDLPDWPSLAAIAPAAAFSARHGAILLGWRAAGAALRPPALSTPALPG